jgi:hypothetical protein
MINLLPTLQHLLPTCQYFKAIISPKTVLIDRVKYFRFKIIKDKAINDSKIPIKNEPFLLLV